MNRHLSGGSYVLRNRHGHVDVRDGPRFVSRQGLGRFSKCSCRHDFLAKSMVALAKSVSIVDPGNAWNRELFRSDDDLELISQISRTLSSLVDAES
jgi:hypothetical protein